MEPEDNTQKQTIAVSTLYFFSGVALGLILLLIYLLTAMLWGSSGIGWNTTTISVLTSVPIACGFLSATFGKNFLRILIAIISNPL